MEIKEGVHPEDARFYSSDRIRKEFLVEKVFNPGGIEMTYSFIDRIIIGGVCPGGSPLELTAGKEIGAAYFLERRELGLINIGGKGAVTIDGKEYSLENRDGLYVGMGAEELVFESENPAEPARFYFNSAPAHRKYEVVKIKIEEAKPQQLGSLEKSNKRTIYKYVHPDVCQSCQLLMGMTLLEPNNVWNTMPCHTHDRRMEVYFYFDISETDVVFHLMGEAAETRHIIVRNEQAVISPSWSIHSGVGTGNYTFIWGMTGENQTFADMDPVPMEVLR